MAEDRRLEGNEKFDAGDIEGALACYLEAGDGRGLENAAAAALRLGRHSDAERYATDAISIQGATVQALFRRAVARRLLGDYEAAYEDLQAASSVCTDADHEDVLRSETMKLFRAARASVPHRQGLGDVVKKHALSSDTSPTPDDLGAACTEPFYLAYKEPFDSTRLENEVKGLSFLYFGPSEVSYDSEDETILSEKGPFVLDVAMSGSCYETELVFRMVFPARYPVAPPKVRCVSLAHLAMFDGPSGSHDAHHSRRATLEFYDMLLSSKNGLGVRSVLDCVQRVLDAPTPHSKRFRERQDIIETFVKKHPHALPELYEEDLEKFLMDVAIDERLRRGEAEFEKVSDGVWSFQLFTPEFSKRLLAEIDCFYASGLPAARPNSMNNYGVIVNDVGLERFVTTLQRLVLQPVARRLFPKAGVYFDSHHSFVVKYRADQDSHLDVHTDDSDVTFNACLGREFEGCGLVFCGMIGTPEHRQHCTTYQHSIGKCVVHLGNRRHGADHITSGERLNLIVWNHGLAWRESPHATKHNRAYEKEQVPPDPRCLSYTHDRDYGNYKEYPRDRTEFKGRGWCPPPGAEYEGFKVENEEEED